MGAGELGRIVVVAVNARSSSDAAFARAVQEMQKGDLLVIVAIRPIRSFDGHYNFAMKPALATLDRESRRVLQKYSALAAAAQVQYEVIEEEGFHFQSSLREVCQRVGADLVVYSSSRHSMRNFCPHCNPYLRGKGRLAPHTPCTAKTMAATTPLPCPAIVLPSGSRASVQGMGIKVLPAYTMPHGNGTEGYVPLISTTA